MFVGLALTPAVHNLHGDLRSWIFGLHLDEKPLLVLFLPLFKVIGLSGIGHLAINRDGVDAVGLLVPFRGISCSCPCPWIFICLLNLFFPLDPPRCARMIYSLARRARTPRARWPSRRLPTVAQTITEIADSSPHRACKATCVSWQLPDLRTHAGAHAPQHRSGFAGTTP